MGGDAQQRSTGRRPTPSARQLLVSLVGIAIGVAGLLFVGLLLARERTTVGEAIRDADVAMVALALVVGLVSMAWIGAQWGAILRAEGAAISPRRYFAWYFVGQLGKYVPGGVWPVVGRSELAVRNGVPRRVGYKTTTMSLLATYAAAGLLALVMLGPTRPLPLVLSWGLPVLALVVAAFAWRVSLIDHCAALVRRMTGGRLDFSDLTTRGVAVLVARHVPAWVGVTTATWLLSRALGFGGDYALFLMVTPAAWLIGFVIVGVPGGIGVREAVFVGMLSASLGDGSAAALAVSARLLFAVVDVTGALGASAVRAGANRRSPISETETGVRAGSRDDAPSGS